MSNNPLVSVIIPMFNAQNSIKETILSVQAQTYQNWEMLVVDNCSTDKSRDILNYLAQRDKRIRLIVSDYNSGGPARPRNIGIRNSCGKYLAFLDSDDLWLKNKLQAEVEFLEDKPEYFLVYANCYVQTDGKITGVTPGNGNSGRVLNQLYLKHNFIACLTVMMRNQKEGAQYFFPEHERFISVEDYLLWLTIAREHKFGFIDEPLGVYVLHKNNLSGGTFKVLRCTKLAIDEFAPLMPKMVVLRAYFSFYRKLVNMGSRQILKNAVNRYNKKER